MNRFSLHFAAFLGSASAVALVLVAGISFACQSARAAMGGDKGLEMRFTPASRPQDGLSHPVNTGHPTGGKPADLRRATREVAAGSPGFAHSSSVSMGESGLSLPAHLRSTMVREPGPSEQGVGPVPGRFGRDARGHFSAGPASMRSDRSAYTATKPSKDNSAVSRGRLESLATSAARLCGVPVRLFHSLIARESSWNPRARSSSGALGLGQLMPAAAKEMGVEDRLDPWQNVLGAACFLRKQYDRAGSWRKALLSYHAGPNRVRTSQATHDYATDIIEASN